MKTITWLLTAAWLLGCAASGPYSEAVSGVQDDFFAKAQLIMSKGEIEIYKHLADSQARDEFIADFWKKRDQQSATEENEFKREFYDRVEYANRWFHERGSAANGWNTERGHILLILGMPDRRELMPMLNNPTVKAAEIWSYYGFALHLEFLDREGTGRFRLDDWPLELVTAIDHVRELGGGKNYFRFKVSAAAAGLLIEIPVKYAMFEERGDNIHAAFMITIDVYCDYVKIERLAFRSEFDESRGTFMERKTIAIPVSYTYPKSGKYFLDVTVEETATRKRFREFARFKQAGRK